MSLSFQPRSFLLSPDLFIYSSETSALSGHQTTVRSVCSLEKGLALKCKELEHVIHNPHTYNICIDALSRRLLFSNALLMFLIPDPDTHLPGLCLSLSFSLSASMDANRK